MGSRIAYSTIGIFAIVVSLTQASNLVAWGLSLTSRELPPVQAQATQPQPKQEGTLDSGEVSGFAPKHIAASAIDLDLPIISSPLVNGTWEVFDGVANYAEGTSPVSSAGGNVGLFAHDRANGFHQIKELNVGDKIEISGDGQTARYVVFEKTVISPSDVAVFNPTESSMLTLITCEGIFSEKRYMVRAELEEIVTE